MQTNGWNTNPLKQKDMKTFDKLKRAFEDFLLYPSLIVLALLILSAVTNYLDRAQAFSPLHSFLERFIFTSSDVTTEFITTATGGLMTVTSIVISMLLVVLQQTATTMGERIFNQFLYRKGNQLLFGFFVGVTVYAILTTALQNQETNSVFAATLLLILIVIVLYLLTVLLYSTISQMRPETIISAVHNHTLTARSHQLDLIQRTRNTPGYLQGAHVAVHARQHGYVTRLKLDKLTQAIESAGCPAEVTLYFSIGSFIAYEDVIAEVRAETAPAANRIAAEFHQFLRTERQRDIHYDAAYGIEQLEIIGWTSISTAKSDPSPGIMVIHSLRDIISRLIEHGLYPEKHQDQPVVYSDNVPQKLFDSLESLAVASSESIQPQTINEVIRTLAILYSRLDEKSRLRVDDMTLRILSILGDHALTGELDSTIQVYIKTLEESGKPHIAAAVAQARAELEKSVGILASRSTRARPD